MGFTNSSLISLTRISPNRNSPRNQPITKITVHHMAGVSSIERFGNLVANPARQMSANYAIGNDGRIGLFCPESDRSWCSSSAWNDNRAITIEVSNSSDGGDWPIGNAAYNSLVKLCVDICKRNGIKKLQFTGDKNGSLTFHYQFSPTCCPGPWMKAHAQDLCNKVNAQLKVNTVPAPPTPTKTYTVSLKATDAVYATAGGKRTGTVGSNGVFTIVENKTIGNTTYGKLKSGAGWVVVKRTTNTTSPVSFTVGDLVKISSNAVYYSGGNIPSWVKEENWYIASISGNRAVLGLNESKNRNIQSPVNTKYLTKVAGVHTIKVGDWVKVLNPVVYGTNKKFTVYASKYKVLELKGDRAVISSDGKNITSPISIKNIQKV